MRPDDRTLPPALAGLGAFFLMIAGLAVIARGAVSLEAALAAYVGLLALEMYWLDRVVEIATRARRKT